LKSLLFSLIVLFAACAQKSDRPPATTTTFLISGPEQPQTPGVEVRRFDIQQEAIGRGDDVMLTLQLQVAANPPALAIDWHAPDGWVVAHDVLDVTNGTRTVRAPGSIFAEPGRYRAVLRSGLASLAEDTVSVSG
jgi:hypothetical protein